jgi:hypothetical protein
VDSCSRFVNDGRPVFWGFLDRDMLDCWFRDFLAISELCAPSVSTSDITIGECGFPLAGQVFFSYLLLLELG